MTTAEESIAARLQGVQQRIRQYCQEAGRDPTSVHLLAVSKTKPLSAVQAAYAAGQRDFGESYVQEALSKIHAFHPQDLVWHFIGPIQANKTRAIAEHFAWVHSVDRVKIAERLSAQRPDALPPLNVCVQVNVDDEPTKSGVSLTELPALMQAVNQLPRLRLRGLMAVPAMRTELSLQRQPFAQLRVALQSLQRQAMALDTLSMGMSGDLEAAIIEGTTWVRLGSAIFGAR